MECSRWKALFFVVGLLPSQAFFVSSTRCHHITLKPHVLSLGEGNEENKAVKEAASNLDVRLERSIENLSENDGSGGFSGRTSKMVSDMSSNKGINAIQSVANTAKEGIQRTATSAQASAEFVSEATKGTLSVMTRKGISAIEATGEGVNYITNEVQTTIQEAGGTVKDSAKTTAKALTEIADYGLERGSKLRAVSSAALRSTSSQVAQTGGNIASTTKHGVQSVVNATNTGVMSVAGVAGAAFSHVVHEGAQTATGIATTASSLAEKGGANAQFVSTVTSQRLSVLARKGTKGASFVVHWIHDQAKDSSTAANANTKAFILRFTGKPDYQFGDITKEVLHRAAASDFNTKDMMLLLKLLLTLGVSFTPLAKIMPLTVLLELLNESLETRVGGKLLEVLAGSVDSRFIAAFDAEEIGDFAKRSLSTAIVLFTGKDDYKEGDIARAVGSSQSGSQEGTLPPPAPKTLNVVVGPSFEDWDRAFRQSQTTIDEAIAQSFDSSLSQEDAKTLDSAMVDALC